MFSTLSRELHDKLSRHIAAAYTMSAIIELEPLVDSCINLFMDKINDHVTDKRPMNMAKWFQWYAFDVIGELTFSRRFGFLENEKDVEDAIFTLDVFTYYVVLIGQAFGYHWLLLGNPLLAQITKKLAASGVVSQVSVLNSSTSSSECES